MSQLLQTTVILAVVAYLVVESESLLHPFRTKALFYHAFRDGVRNGRAGKYDYVYYQPVYRYSRYGHGRRYTHYEPQSFPPVFGAKISQVSGGYGVVPTGGYPSPHIASYPNIGIGASPIPDVLAHLTAGALGHARNVVAHVTGALAHPTGGYSIAGGVTGGYL